MSPMLTDIERMKLHDEQVALDRSFLRLPELQSPRYRHARDDNARRDLTRSISIYGTGGEQEYGDNRGYALGALEWSSYVDRTRFSALHVTIRAAPGCTIDAVLEDQSLPGPKVTSRSPEQVTVFAPYTYYTIILGEGREA